MSPNDPIIRIGAIIPAAGCSRRMGRSKQTLPFGGSTMAGTITRVLFDAGVDQVVVVTQTGLLGALKLPDDPRVRLAINDDPTSEMIDSICIGLRKLSEHKAAAGDGNGDATRAEGSRDSASTAAPVDGILVLPGDMPCVSPAACRSCMETFRRDPSRIVVATYQRRRGHPIVFPWSLRAEVKRISGGLNRILEFLPELVRLVETTNPGTLSDIDTTADLNGLERTGDEYAPDA